MYIAEILDGIHPLPLASRQLLVDCTTEIAGKKGQILLHAGRIEKTVYFVKTGIVRAFAPMDTQEVTFWFGEEGSTILSIKSYVNNEKGYENIELLSDCELYELKTDDLNMLYQHDLHIANWGRKLAEREWLKLESRILSSTLLPAKERYVRLMAEFPGIIQRVPLKHIASYLGITQVSLSRIRKEK